MAEKSVAGRVCKWDNLKCFLIVMVVVGHFVNQYAADSDTMKSFSIFIYSFHMPLFIFLSGLLERKWNAQHPFRWSKPVYYIMIGYALKFCIYGIKLLFHQKAQFQWWEDTGIPWYMFAMAALLALTYLLRRWDVRLVLPISIFAACMAGYVEEIGSFLYLSRILVFFPFYYLGYHLDMRAVLKVLDRLWIKCLSAIFLTDVFLISLAKVDTLYHYIRLFTSRNAYSLIRVEHCGFFHRLGFYGLAFLMGAAIISLIPNRELPLCSEIGARTLQIYFWHRLVLYVLMFSGATDGLVRAFPTGWMWMYLAMAFLLPFVLSVQLFNAPLLMLKRLQNAIYDGALALRAGIFGWAKSTIPVLSAIELLALLSMLIYYGGEYIEIF